MNTIPPHELSALLDSAMQRKLSTIAALVVLLYEHCITLKDEVRHIWRKKFNPVLGTYIFSKYMGIVAQSINVYKAVGPMAIPGRTSQEDCMSWFSSGIAAALILLAALDIILMLRVYALYRKTTSIGVLLSTLFVGQLISNVVFGRKSIYEVSYNAICDTQETHAAVLHFGIVLWTVHLTLLLLTGLKYNLVVMGIPVAKLVTRDGVWVVGILCPSIGSRPSSELTYFELGSVSQKYQVLFAVTIPYALTIQVAQADLAFVWPTTFFSIACCRVIMNMQALDIGQPDQERGICSASSTCDIVLTELGPGL
ncbi:hypothetical protein CPC08DRAFT_729937 [Agrocybe pediades]|nr:hypothetical protein CPC08DRAFT_729937 [Agrocybe pediades]